MKKYLFMIIASLALFTGRANAQRCLPKMQGIEVRANMADGFNPGGNDGGYSFGAALSTYTKKGRSEEHTSELQSHPVISYAVFCLKKIFF